VVATDRGPSYGEACQQDAAMDDRHFDLRARAEERQRSREEERVIDFLVRPFGLDAADVLRTSLPVEVLDDAGRPTGARSRVMHPERWLESRVHNVVGLPGTTRRGRSSSFERPSCARESSFAPARRVVRWFGIPREESRHGKGKDWQVTTPLLLHPQSIFG